MEKSIKKVIDLFITFVHFMGLAEWVSYCYFSQLP